MKDFKFTKGVEKLINPIDVGTLHFLQSFNDKLPKNVQNKLVEKSSEKNPLMGFVVEPYCFFLCYEITDSKGFDEMLPDGFELVRTKIFDDDEEKYYFILSCFNARTSAFFGSRLEAYAIAKNLETNLTSWVILEYDTNTISYDTKNGLTNPNSTDGIITTDFSGRVIVDIKRNDKSRELVFSSSIKDAKLKKLDYKLWVEGNLSVAYSKKLSNDSDVFSLRFNPKEMDEALKIDSSKLNILKNNWYEEYIEREPSQVVCFPYAQHFLSDSPGFSSNITTEEELVENINNINFDNINVYSTESFKKLILILPTILTLIIIILLVLLVITNI